MIAGDAIYTLRASSTTRPSRRARSDRHTWRRSLRELRLFRRQYPQAVIIPGHDPELGDRLERRYE